MGGPTPQIKHYNPPSMPDYQKADIPGLNQQAIGYDANAYQLSDADFRRRNPQIVQATKNFNNAALADSQGQITPQINNELVNAGISSSLNAFGDGSIAPNSAAEANVARNLGVGVLDFQDRMRNRTANDLMTSQQLYGGQPRTFGFGGEGALQLSLANLAGQNNWNQANYASQVQAGQYNSQIDATNQNARVQKSNGTTGAMGSAVGAAAAAAAICWVAREVYGVDSPKWKQFRSWLFKSAPVWFARLYILHGRWFASFISSKPCLKFCVRSGMDLAIA
jgi:hypothetical protein